MKPSSDTQHRDQGMDKDRKKFTAGVIRALEELQVRRLSRSPQQLADAAWQQLQYDYPLLETEELQALVATLRASFVGKAGWPCYLVTHKALENISTGARGAGSYAPQLSEQEQQVQQMLAESLTSRVMGRSSSSNTSSAGAHNRQQQQAQQQQPVSQQQQQEPVSQQQLYQELAAVLLLQYAAKVASLPDQEAWQLLQAYCPEHTQPDTSEPLAKQPQQQQQQEAAGGAAILQPGSIAEAGCGGGGLGGQASSCSIYEDTEAAQQDADSEEYEPLEAPQQHSSFMAGSSSSSSSRLQQQQHGLRAAGAADTSLPQQHPHAQHDPQPFSWSALQHKLLSLSDHVHYSLLSHEPLWKHHGAAQHLLQLLRLLGVHSHTQELQPLLHAYVGLLVDRLAAAPQDLPLLHQLWEALGLTLGSGLKSCVSGPNSAKPQGQQGLYPEAVLGLSVAAAVWGQLPSAAARRQLWQVMHQDLLPLLESCAEQLAYSSKGKAAASSSSSGSNGAAAAGCTQGVAFAHVLLLSHVVELLVVGRPGPHVDAAKQLTDAGVMRSLVQLHLQWGCQAAAEPLRHAVLLACCSSPHAAAWVLAVPGTRQQLQQQCFQLGAPLESHGAIWQLLLHPSTQLQKQDGANGTCGAADAGTAQQLVSLLQLDSSSVQQLQRQVVVLQLMADAQRAAGGQQRLWGKQVQSALRKLAAQLKEMDVSAGRRTHTAAGGKSSLSSRGSDADSEDEHADGAAEPPLQQQQRADIEQHLGHRRSAQLQPAALRLVKELLSQGGGKTD